MKLALVIFRYFPFGGLQRTAFNMAVEAVRRGHDVTFFCSDWSGDYISGVNVRLIESVGFFNVAGVSGFINGFLKSFNREEFDLVVGFNKMPGLDVYYCGDSCFAQKAWCERSWVYRLASRTRLYLRNEEAVFGCDSATKILDISPVERPLFARFYGTSPDRFHLLPPGIKKQESNSDFSSSGVDLIRKEFAISSQAKVLLCVGSGFRTKGLDRSIEILAELVKREKLDVYLLVVGADKPAPYMRIAKGLCISDRVIFAGGRTDVRGFYREADLLLHPAYREVAGNVLLEAMLSGLPVVATDVCGYSSYIHDYGMGAVIPSVGSTPVEFSHAIVELLRYPRQRWGSSAERLAQADLFSRAQKAVDFFENTISQPACQSRRGSFGESVILRSPFLDKWMSSSIFDLVKNLSGVAVRSMPGRNTVRFEFNGKTYYRKFHTGVGWREIIKNFLYLRIPVLGASNEWYALNHLAALGIPSLTVLAFGRKGLNPARQQSFVVTEALEGCIKLDEVFTTSEVSFRTKLLILDKVARISRELHGAGINHRDFYLCHFLLEPGSLQVGLNGQCNPVIHLVDLHRAQLRLRVPERWLVKDLGGLLFSSLNLGFSHRDYYRFLIRYFDADLRTILIEHKKIIKKVVARSRSTYKRDFGHLPKL